MAVLYKTGRFRKRLLVILYSNYAKLQYNEESFRWLKNQHLKKYECHLSGQTTQWPPFAEPMRSIKPIVFSV
jgi:hypothetical protein